MIRAAYERLFVAFYGWSLKVDGKKGGFNLYYASLMLSLALLLNVACIAMVIDMLVPHPFLLSATQISKTWWVFIFVVLIAGQFLYFKHRERYLKLPVAYKQGEADSGFARHWKLLTYMVTSFVFFVVLLVARLK